MSGVPAVQRCLWRCRLGRAVLGSLDVIPGQPGLEVEAGDVVVDFVGRALGYAGLRPFDHCPAVAPECVEVKRSAVLPEPFRDIGDAAFFGSLN